MMVVLPAEEFANVVITSPFANPVESSSFILYRLASIVPMRSPFAV